MNWYTGDIAQAINLAKIRGAIFVVYCEGEKTLKWISQYKNKIFRL